MRISKNEKESLTTALSFEQLEDRILFSADSSVLIPHLDIESNPSHQTDPTTIEIMTETTSTQESVSARNEIAFVDKRIENYETLVNDILNSKNDNTNLQIVLLDKGVDGLEKISEVLNNKKDVSAIHIFSHSTDGVLKLGTKALIYDNIDAHADTLIAWQNTLTPDADILLYGCDLAQTEIGQKFIEKLSLLTGSDVAASSDTSGTTHLGANWDLEYTTGTIESNTLIKTDSNISWSGTLNTAPTASNNTIETKIGAIYTFTAADFNFQDLEGDSFSQVQILTLPLLGGLFLSGNSILLLDTISITDINNGNFTFNPLLGILGTSFTFKVHDGTVYSDATYTMTLNLSPNNTPPTAANNTVTFDEDSSYTISVSDFQYSDAENNSLNQVRITTLPTNGLLTLSGVAVTLNQTINVADIESGNLIFTPAANANGVGYASFGFSVRDGIGFSVSSYTLTFNVTPTNDLPTTANQTVSTNEDTAYSFTSADFNFNDIDGDALTQIRINSLPANGSLTLSGVAVALNQIISVADINAGNLRFTPAANANGVGYASFNFSVHDGTGFSLTGATMTIDVIKSNHLPNPNHPVISNPLPEAPETTTPEENTKDNDTTNNNPTKKVPVSYNPQTYKNQNHTLNTYNTHTVDTLKISLFNLNYENEFDFNNENNSQSTKTQNNTNYQDLKVKNQFSHNAFLSTLENIQISYNAYFTQLHNHEIMISAIKNTLTVTGLAVGLIATPWILNATTLLASLCASATIWSSVDPLPIVVKKKGSSTTKNSESDNIDALFEKK